MGVIQDASHTFGELGKDVCIVCADQIESYPYVYWLGGRGTFFICSSCCREMGRALFSDTSLVVAIETLQEVATVGSA